jgi:hypothetical protein
VDRLPFAASLFNHIIFAMPRFDDIRLRARAASQSARPYLELEAACMRIGNQPA